MIYLVIISSRYKKYTATNVFHTHWSKPVKKSYLKIPKNTARNPYHPTFVYPSHWSTATTLCNYHWLPYIINGLTEQKKTTNELFCIIYAIKWWHILLSCWRIFWNANLAKLLWTEVILPYLRLLNDPEAEISSIAHSHTCKMEFVMSL